MEISSSLWWWGCDCYALTGSIRTWLTLPLRQRVLATALVLDRPDPGSSTTGLRLTTRWFGAILVHLTSKIGFVWEVVGRRVTVRWLLVISYYHRISGGEMTLDDRHRNDEQRRPPFIPPPFTAILHHLTLRMWHATCKPSPSSDITDLRPSTSWRWRWRVTMPTLYFSRRLRIVDMTQQMTQSYPSLFLPHFDYHHNRHQSSFWDQCEAFVVHDRPSYGHGRCESFGTLWTKHPTSYPIPSFLDIIIMNNTIDHMYSTHTIYLLFTFLLSNIIFPVKSVKLNYGNYW